MGFIDNHYERVIESLMKTVQSPLFILDSESKIKYCNDLFCKFLNVNRSNILGNRTDHLFPEKLADAISESDHKINVNEPEYKESLYININGYEEIINFHRSGFFDKQGRYLGSSCSLQSINQMRDLEEHSIRVMRLKDAILAINNYIKDITDLISLFDLILEKVLLAIDHASVGCVLLLDDNRKLRIVSAIGYCMQNIGGFSIDVEDTFHWKEAASEPSETLIINDLQDFMVSHNMPDTLLTDESGNIIRSTMSTPLIVEGALYGFINLDSREDNIFDETDRALLECIRSQVPVAISMFKAFEHTLYESQHDTLTKLYNRRYFENIWSVIQKKALRYQEQFHLVLFDLNYFKQVNDRYGHHAGDRLLLFFADEMNRWFRSSDIFARYGGGRVCCPNVQC